MSYFSSLLQVQFLVVSCRFTYIILYAVLKSKSQYMLQGSIGMLVPYAQFYSFENFIKFGIIGATSFALLLFLTDGVLISAFLYLHLICYACYLRFKKVNSQIRDFISLVNKSKTSINSKIFYSVIKEHDEACSSLNEFNKFWRLIICVIYLGYQPMFCMMLLQAIMLEAGPMTMLIKLSNGFGAINVLVIIQVFALSAERVSTEAFSIYPKLVALILNSTGKLDVKERM